MVEITNHEQDDDAQELLEDDFIINELVMTANPGEAKQNMEDMIAHTRFME